MIRDGMWAGRRCFILGGGPSLAKEPLDLLRGEVVLSVNMAFLCAEPTLAFVQDLELMRRLASDPRWLACKAAKVWLNCEAPSEGWYPEGVEVVRESFDVAFKGPFWSRTLKDGIYRATNAGLSAINLAEILGADPIHLLGFDMHSSSPRPANFHSDYGPGHPQDVYERFIPDFERNLPFYRARIVNLTEGSRLRIFPRCSLKEVLTPP